MHKICSCCLRLPNAMSIPYLPLNESVYSFATADIYDSVFDSLHTKYVSVLSVAFKSMLP